MNYTEMIEFDYVNYPQLFEHFIADIKFINASYNLTYYLSALVVIILAYFYNRFTRIKSGKHISLPVHNSILY